MRASARIPSIAVLCAGGLLLAGCTFSAGANLTQSAEEVADVAARALEEQVGTRPDLDCGDEQVDLIDGETVDCVLTDPNTGTSFETEVTITNVDGSKYAVDVQVGTEPIQG